MKCAEAKSQLSPCLDRALTGKQVSALNQHLAECASCRREYMLMQSTQRMLASLAPVQPPKDLALKVRIAVSRELAASRRNPWEGVLVRLSNAVNALLVPATAGTLTAVIMFGLLIGMMFPRQVNGADVPLMVHTAPQLSFAPFGVEAGALNGDALVVEATVDSRGRVQDYRILNAPANAERLMPELKNMLIFSVFRPATSFGQPVSGKVILSFSKINVAG